MAAALLSCSSVCMTAYAADTESVDVYVTISDGSATPVLIQKPVTVTDTDNDGALTINDALYIAHEDYFTGGAAAGYASGEGQYGLELRKLWGLDHGIDYGYYVDNKGANGLRDTVSDNNQIYAFAYTDRTAFSDTYSWFDKIKTDAKQGDEIELTLSHIGYAADWSPLTLPVEGAVITVNGNDTEYKTDAEGKVKIKLDTAGEDIISAKSDSLILVPPVCVANVAADSEVTTTSAPETTTTSTETTTSDTTTSSSTTTSATTTKTTTTTAKSGGSSTSDSPKTGDMGTGSAVVILGTAVCTAFALRKKNEK